jgi:aminomethyltransferase
MDGGADKGYEIYLYDATRDAEKMWHHILEVGKQFNLRVIAPGHHRRIEAGILSYGQDIDIESNPFECGLAWQVDFSKDNFIGKAALQKIANEGVNQKLVGIKMHGGKPIDWYVSDFYHIRDQKSGELIGHVTSGWYSPTLKCNIAMGYVPTGYSDLGTKFDVVLPDVYADESTGNVVSAEAVATPFKMPDTAELGTGLRQTGSKL